MKAFPFYKIKLIKLANRLNYRNHRKIIVIDARISFDAALREIEFSAAKKNRRKTLIIATKRHKKAVLLKNCFDDLYSKNDNSIRLPTAGKKPPAV